MPMSGQSNSAKGVLNASPTHRWLFLWSPSLHLKQDVDPFSPFCTARTRDIQTDWQTDAEIVKQKSRHVMCLMRPKSLRVGDTCLVLDDLWCDVLRSSAQRVRPTLHSLCKPKVCHLPSTTKYYTSLRSVLQCSKRKSMNTWYGSLAPNHTCLCLPSLSWFSFTDPEAWRDGRLSWPRHHNSE